MTDDKLDANDILRGEGPDGVRRLNDGAKKLWRAPEVIDRGPQRGGNGAGPRDGPKPRKQVRVTMGANMEPQKIVWLWDGWLARGKLHILAGRPGSLKTTAAMSFAAAVTRGGQWPDGSAAEAGNVLIWSGEDAVDDTLLPRFIAAGGDRARVAFVSGVEEGGRKRSFNPASDMEALAAVCAELGDIKLVIIDPVVAVAKGDSHKNAEARRDLQPLVDLAEKTQAAVLGIHHLTKRTEGADPVDRISGSLAFGAGPRVVLSNALDSQGPTETRGLLMRAKSNIGPAYGGFEFTAETRPIDGYPHISAQSILWGSVVTDSARDILEKIEGKEAKAATSKRKVNAFLLGALQGRGERLAAEVIAEGEAEGFSESALRRAFKKMGGQSEKASMKTGWIWSLPDGEGAPNVIRFPGGRDGRDGDDDDHLSP
jgi:putative DNA primase/helicase